MKMLCSVFIELLLVSLCSCQSDLTISLFPSWFPVVNTINGPVRGTNYPWTSARMFKGIRYGRAPTGPLRFRAPQSPDPWTEIRNAFEHGNSCPQLALIGGQVEGAEDCLFLNVYTPHNTTANSNLAVMLFIHGGGFIAGNGDADVHGPQYFVRYNVLLVTLNFRLSSMGYLSSQDENAPGNQGMKDIVFALKWVKANIRPFGGDPNRVTIFGASSGAASVTYLCLSDSAKDLFSAAISQSGSALSSWAFQPDPWGKMQELGSRLGLTWTSRADLVAQLQVLPFEQVVAAEETPYNDDLFGFVPFIYAPSIDGPNSAEAIFLSDSPRRIAKKKALNNEDICHGKPLLMGYNSDDAAFARIIFLVKPNLFDIINNNNTLLVPGECLEAPRSSQELADIAEDMLQFYYNNNPLTFPQNELQLYQMATDIGFFWNIHRFIEQKATTGTVYAYQFAYSGPLNYMKQATFPLDAFRIEGAIHGDEISYQFEHDASIYPPHASSAVTEAILTLSGSLAIRVRASINIMWTDFAKTWNPTPLPLNPTVGVVWPAVTNPNNFSIMLINATNSIVPERRRPNLNFLNSLNCN